jgi:hypothetical protein
MQPVPADVNQPPGSGKLPPIAASADSLINNAERKHHYDRDERSKHDHVSTPLFLPI